MARNHVNMSGIRRNFKNIAHNYTDAQVKVREATSNDPWGPSSTIMSEIADLTMNVVAFSEIMQMVWKRLNDHGKNWRHVYKALVLLEYLIKTGSDKVAEQSRENLHSISTLKDFQHVEEGKDQGINVREKAKTLVALLKDDERLRAERVRALKAKERFAQSITPQDPTFVTSSSRQEREAYGVREPASTAYGELENARPHTLGEEELQLQLALAMSKEEADSEEARRRSDDVRLAMALSESQGEREEDEPTSQKTEAAPQPAINDLLEINFAPQTASPALGLQDAGVGSPTDPWGLSNPPLADPWGGIGVPETRPRRYDTQAPPDPWAAPPPNAAPAAIDPWAPVAAPVAAPAPVDPWAPAPALALDPFAPLPPSRSPTDEFSVLSSRDKPESGAFELMGLEDSLPTGVSAAKRKSPASFLGENSNLVNLDNLVATKQAQPSAASPSPSPSLSTLLSSPSLNPSIPPNSAMSPTNPFAGPLTVPLAGHNTVPLAGANLVPLAGANPFSGQTAPNPFTAAQPPKPSINELRGSQAPQSTPAPGVWGGDPFTA